MGYTSLTPRSKLASRLLAKCHGATIVDNLFLLDRDHPSSAIILGSRQPIMLCDSGHLEWLKYGLCWLVPVPPTPDGFVPASLYLEL